MRAPSPDRMTPAELRAGASLASIFALRMLGLFLILPVFAVFAQTLPGGDNLMLVGIALGAYGLTQAMFQIAYGVASDHYGRKPVIIFGLVAALYFMICYPLTSLSRALERRLANLSVSPAKAGVNGKSGFRPSPE